MEKNILTHPRVPPYRFFLRKQALLVLELNFLPHRFQIELKKMAGKIGRGVEMQRSRENGKMDESENKINRIE